MTFPVPDPETLQSHVAFVRSVARAALGGDAEFEDVAQETWVAALEGAPSHPRALRAWLAKVARRQAALRLRRRSRERRRVAHRAEVDGLHRAPPDPAADVLARAEAGRRLVDAMLALPEIYRSVLLLRYHDDLPPREVARRLDLPVETVRTRARRGLAQLRDRLEATERRRGADWRGSLLLLIPHTPPGVSTSLGAIVGAVLVKKSILAAAAVLLLLGGAVLWRRPWSSSTAPEGRVDAPVLGSVPGTDPDAVDQGEAEATRLRGRTAAASSLASDLPPPVDLSTVDRDRDLHGIVQDLATGEVVAGAEIRLLEKTWGRGVAFDAARRAEQRVCGETRSAVDGTWRIRLEPGDAPELHVRAAGYVEHRVRAAQAGERILVGLVRGTTLRVRVLDSRDRVQSGASVRVFQARQDRDDGHGFAALRGVTDDAGVYAAVGLPPGAAVWIDASHPVLGSAMWREARAAEHGTAEVEVRIPAGRVLTGRVTDVRTGAPIAGARVGIGWTLDAAVTTDAAGDYVLPGWTGQGVYEIAVRAAGHAQDETLVGSRTHIDFALQPEARIRGRVVDDAGRPVPDVRVSAIGSSWETGRQVTSSGTAETDRDGGFEITGLRHDMPHRLILVARGYGRTLYDVPPPEAGGTCEVGAVRITAAGSIAGVVRHPDGRPLQRVALLLEGGNADRGVLLDGAPSPDHDYGLAEERYTDDLGRFRFRDLAPGSYVVTVRLPGGSSVEREVSLSAEAPVSRVTLIVNEGRRFTVRVEETTGEPVDLATVHLATSTGERLRASTGASGRAVFSILGEPTSVDVDTGFELSHKRYMDPEEEAVAEGVDEVLVRLVPADVIRGRVLDARDEPLPLVTLRAVHGGVVVADGWTRRNGTFQLVVPSGVAVDVELEGTRLEESASGFVASEAFLEGRVEGVTAGEDGVILRARTVPLDGVVEVRVTDPAGRPLSAAVVFASRPDGHGVATARTGPDGSAVLRGLPVAELEFGAARAPRAQGEEWVIPAGVRAVPGGQMLSLAYRPGAHVGGTVVDGEGRPVADARVEAAYEGGAYHATTDEEGRFDARVPAAAEEITVRLIQTGDPGAEGGAVRARPGDTGLRLRVE